MLTKNHFQSESLDSDLGRFLNADDMAFLGASGTVLGYNLYGYCENKPVFNMDYMGNISLKAALSEIKGFLNKIVSSFVRYLKNLFYYDKVRKIFNISTTVISTIIDTIIVAVTNGFIYKGIKTGLRLLLKNKKIRNSIISGMLEFFLYNKGGKFILWTIVQIGFSVAGRPGAIGTATSGVFNGYLSNILTFKNTMIQKSASLISAFSSVGGLTAFFLDLIDGKWDDYLRIKLR